MRKLKKLFYSTALILSSVTSAHANGGTVAEHHAGNIYIGGAISLDSGDIDTRETSRFFVDQNHEIVSIRKNFDFSMLGAGGTLFGGWMTTWRDNFTFAFEGFGSASSNRGDFKKQIFVPAFNLLGEVDGTRTLATSATVEQEWSAGLSLLPGIMLGQQTNLFARIGWIISEFRVNGRVDGINGFLIINPRDIWTQNQLALYGRDKDLNGIQLGLGMQSMLDDNVGVRGEWDWAGYESATYKANLVDSIARHANQNILEFKNPVIDQFKFSILYKFGAA